MDNWLKIVREKLKPYNIKICAQYHDELLIWCEKKYKDILKGILVDSMEEVNKKIHLNIEIQVSVSFGKNYAEVH